VSDVEAKRLAAALVSRRVGLVTEVMPQQRGPEEPVPPYLYTATLAHFDFRAAPRRERLNAGKGRTEAEATMSALGEAVERYSAYHWDPSRVWVGLAEPDAVTPSDCVLYSETQYNSKIRYTRWSPQMQTSWIRGVELPSRTPVAVPAALVYLVSPLPRPEDYVAAITSNGLAAGSDLTRAILGGLYELVERDALMITWMNRLPGTEIETPESGCFAASVIRHYRRFDVGVRLFQLHTDQVPHVVLSVADNPAGDGPARVIGMGCDIDPIAAVDKAVFEMCQARPSEAVRFRETNPAVRLKHYEDVHDIDDHPGFHSLREHAAEFDFLSATGQRVNLMNMTRPAATDDETGLDAIVEGLRRSGARVAYVEITAPDVASTGLRVVRCFATGLQPIHFGFGDGRLGGRRLFEAPVAWGMAPRMLTEDELNACPHPLA
jgi:ribosomal protein S12 methylthiotransferase accessory factor